MPATATEGGTRDKRYEFERETTVGVYPSDPAFKLPSDNVTSFEWSPTGGTELRRGLGTADVVEVHYGAEEHEVSIEYDMQEFPVDGSGNPNSLDGDGVLRDGPQNALPNTHTLVRRERKDEIDPKQAVDGSTSRDTHTYTVMVGGFVDDVTYTGDPGSQQPVVVSVTYQAEKVRQYQIDQPTGETLQVASSDASDTNIDVIIENSDASTSETLTTDGTDGTTSVSGVETFSEIDAIELGSEATGDITVSDSSGNALAVIRGGDFYGHGEGDLGVPTLGTGGSRASAIATDYETITGDTVERPSGTDVGFEINSVEFTVSNNIASRTNVTSPRMPLSADDREVEVTTTLVGQTESVAQAEDLLSGATDNVIWTLDGGTLQADAAGLTDFGGIADEMGESAMSLDNTFTGQGITVSSS